MVIYPHVVVQLTLSEQDVDTLSGIFKKYSALHKENELPTAEWVLMNEFQFESHFEFHSKKFDGSDEAINESLKAVSNG